MWKGHKTVASHVFMRGVVDSVWFRSAEGAGLLLVVAEVSESQE